MKTLKQIVGEQIYQDHYKDKPIELIFECLTRTKTEPSLAEVFRAKEPYLKASYLIRLGMSELVPLALTNKNFNELLRAAYLLCKLSTY